MRVSPSVRPGMRTSASYLSFQTTRSGIDAGGFVSGAGAGAVTADAGTGAAVAGAAATCRCRLYMHVIRRFSTG